MKTSPIQSQSKYNKMPGTTNFKSNVSYSSPKAPLQDYKLQNNYQNLYKRLNFKEDSNYPEAKNILRQSHRRIASSISMADFFKENIENRDVIRQSAYTKVLNSANRTEELQIIQNEHRIQVQKLLLQISRLHDVIYEMQRSKRYQLQRLKQQYEQMTYLHLNNQKQAHISQIQILEIQLKKTKQALDDKSYELEQIQRTVSKDRQMFKTEIQNLRNNLKQVVNKKNQELFQIQQKSQQKLREATRNNTTAIQQMKQTCDQDIKKIKKELLQKQQNLNRLKTEITKNSKRNDQIQQELQKQKVQLEERLQKYISQSNYKHEMLSNHIKQVLQNQQQSQNEKEALLKEIYENQINNLLKIIKLKNGENMQLKTHLQSKLVQFKLLMKNTDEENQYLRKLIKDLQQKNLQQIQKLKAKMALLHQNDINQLIKLYETKIQNLTQELGRQSNQTVRLRDYMHQETHRWYEYKKNYQNTISKLNIQVLRLRSGLGNMEKNMNQRLQNQRSALLLTSQSLIRGAQLKNTNAQFYEEEARKLRLTIQKLEHLSEQTQKQLKAQISRLQDQIRRIIEVNKQNQAQNHKIQQRRLAIQIQKENQIKRLNKITQELIQQKQKNQQAKNVELKVHIEQLNKLIQDKNDKIKQLISRAQKLQRDIQQLRVQNQQLYLQNQINHQQAKNQYEKIANSNIKSLKQFYERRITELELDKNQLKIKQSADQANITELIRRYQQLQEYVKKILKQSKKRSQLQQRIINLGMDNNLVKNKAILFAEQNQQNE